MATTTKGWAVWVRWANGSETLDIECPTREQAAREAATYSRQLCESGYAWTGMSVRAVAS